MGHSRLNLGRDYDHMISRQAKALEDCPTKYNIVAGKTGDNPGKRHGYIFDLEAKESVISRYTKEKLDRAIERINVVFG